MSERCVEDEVRPMRMRATRVFWLLIFLMSLALETAAQNRTAVSKSPREFVQECYGWYVPKAVSKSAPAWNVAVEQRASDFTHELVQLLQRDSAAQAACRELVGLDCDPFLNSQDPASWYEVGGAKQRGRQFQVDLYSEESGRRSKDPSVTVEVSRTGGRWVFVNFVYPDGTNLLDTLKLPRPKCGVPRSPVRKR